VWLRERCVSAGRPVEAGREAEVGASTAVA